MPLIWLALGFVLVGITVALVRTWPAQILGPQKPRLAEAFELREHYSEIPPAPEESGGILVHSDVEDPALGPLAKLPPFSPVAISLMRQFDRDEVHLQKVTSLVESDPALATELLAVVNSPLFAFQGKVTSPAHGITLLGVERTQSLAVTLAMRSMMLGAPRTPVVRRFWNHSLATATIARECAGSYSVDPDLAHTAALLHDLGRMGLLAAHPAEYSRLALAAHEDVAAILASEQEAFGMDHREAGKLLARAWGLPEPFPEAASRHHDNFGKLDFNSLMQISCRLADDLMFEAIHHMGSRKPAETIAAYAPEPIRTQLESQLETARVAVLTAIRELDF